MKQYDKILIFDYGSQYTQLIARRVRELKVFSKILPYDTSIERIKKESPKAIILSGGPMSVYDPNSYQLNKDILNLNIPILGICYGMQLLMHHFGAKVEPSSLREYGSTKIEIINSGKLFKNINQTTENKDSTN